MHAGARVSSSLHGGSRAAGIVASWSPPGECSGLRRCGRGELLPPVAGGTATAYVAIRLAPLFLATQAVPPVARPGPVRRRQCGPLPRPRPRPPDVLPSSFASRRWPGNTTTIGRLPGPFRTPNRKRGTRRKRRRPTESESTRRSSRENVTALDRAKAPHLLGSIRSLAELEQQNHRSKYVHRQVRCVKHNN